MRIKLSLCVASFFMMIGVANALTVLDFESFASPGTGMDYYASPFDVEGYRFTGNALFDDYLIHQTESNHYAGSTALAPFTSETHVLTRVDGQSFSLLSMDFSETFNGTLTDGIGTVNFYGHLMDGGTVSQEITNDGVFGFENVVFPGFLDLLNVEFTYPGTNNMRFQLDNIYLDAAPVPEPSTFLLIGGGLASLAFYARRRKEE